MERDAITFTQKCDKCQRFALISHRPPIEMVPMTNPCSFAQCVMDILGPLSQAPLYREFLIITIDYFTKWIEAEPFAKITERNTKNFIWKNIVCRYGIPKIIVSDNAKQFDNDRFKLLCLDLSISNHFSSFEHS